MRAIEGLVLCNTLNFRDCKKNLTGAKENNHQVNLKENFKKLFDPASLHPLRNKESLHRIHSKQQSKYVNNFSDILKW